MNLDQKTREPPPKEFYFIEDLADFFDGSLRIDKENEKGAMILKREGFPYLNSMNE